MIARIYFLFESIIYCRWWHFCFSNLRVVAIAFTTVVLFGKLLVAEELGVHSLGAHVSLALGLLDTVRMGLLRIVVGARVLLLWWW
jgi:hypothetical protein